MIIKVFFVATLAGMVCPFFQPLVAESIGMEPLNVWGQFGIAGLIAALHWWTIAKTIPVISQSHKDGLGDVAKEVSGLRTDLNTHMDSQLDFLKETIRSEK